MANKPKSFLASRNSTKPDSANDEDFALVMQVNPQAAFRPIYSQDIPVERIRPNPFQARQRFEGLDELAEVIRVQGFISRLRVRPDPAEEGFFQLVYGERRLRAAKLAVLIKLPCDVAEHNDKEMLEIGLAENIQRQDLSPLEEAQAFEKFIEAGGYTVRELADRLGKNKDYVAGRLALLKAPPDVQQLVAQRADTVTVARRIAQLKTLQERAPLIEAILNGTLNKEEVRSIVQELQQLNPTGFVRLDVQIQQLQAENKLESLDVQTAEPANIGSDVNFVRPDVQTAAPPSDISSSANFVRPDVQKIISAAQAIKTALQHKKVKTKSGQNSLQQETVLILTILGRWQEEQAKLEPESREQMQEVAQIIQLELQKLIARF